MLSSNINLRKIGIMFLVFTLVFTGLGASLGTSVSYAASSEVYVSNGGDDQNDGAEATPYATLQKAYQEVDDGGTIYLLNDITLTGGVDVVVAINEGKHVTISTANDANKTAMIKRGKPSGKVLFQLANKSQITLRNIIIDGNSEEMGGAIDGRLFNVYSGSTLTIDEGAILQNSYSLHQGSAIYTNNTGSIVEMKGGEIRDNKRASIGAAIFVDPGARFIMTGGHITNNIGGGVESRGGEIVLSGEANITGNTSDGKAVNVNLANYKTLILNGEFTGEAGITTQSMTPGTKFGRVTDDGLDSIENLIADSGSLVASYDENNALVWRSFKNEISQPSTDGEIVAKRPTLKGVTEPNATVTIKIVSATDPSLVITKEVTADASGNWVLAISETLETSKYTLQVTATKDKTQSEPVTRPFEVGNGVYVASYGKDTTGDGSPGNPYATLSKAYAEVNDGGTIYLLDNITLNPDPKGVMLNFNSDKRVTITTAPEVAETAVIQRGQPNNSINTLFGLTKGELTLKNIIIDGGFENKVINGRIINVYEGSKLIIEEGTILRNSNSQYHGSVIEVNGNGSVVEMNGGEIRDNQLGGTSGIVAPGLGGAVLVTGAKFIMTGGQITDNIGGGVQSRGGEIFLSGNARITGNMNEVSGKSTNVYLPGSDRFTLDGAFTGEAGITASGFMKDGGQFGKAVAGDLDGIENLIADEGPLLSSYGANNTLVWRLFKNELSQPSTDGEKTGINPTLKGVTEPFAEVIIEIVSSADPSFIITEKRTADENGNWELPIDDALDKGAYTITVTANKNKTQSNSVTRPFEVVDKTELQEKVDEITGENLVETKYTEASWKALQEAMDAANDVLGDPAATQEEVKTALEALEKARKELTEKPVNTVDKTALQKKVDEITGENLVETKYTEASWKALQEAMDAANDVLGDPAATQEEVKTALEALEKARKELTEKPVNMVDKTALQKKVDEITGENLVETKYTEASWKALQEAMDAANDVLGDPAATQEEVKTALEALEKARNELAEKPVNTVDKTALQKKVDEITAKNLVETEYTEESWKALQEAMDAAKDALGDPAATQEVVNTALATLEKAEKDLVKLGGELDDLNLVGLTKDGNKDITLKPEFDPNQYKNYQGTVTNDVYGISLNPVVKHPDNTQVKIIVNDIEYPADKWNKLPLKEGKNVITVGVYDKDGNLINEYTIEIVRERASGNDNSGGGNTGGGNSGSGNTGNSNATPPPTTDNTVKPGNIETTANGSNASFASGKVTNTGDRTQTTVTIDKDKLSGILANGKGQKLGIRVPGDGDVEVQGLTVEDLKKLADTGSSLDIEDLLAIYPVPAGQLDVNAISKQFGNAPLGDIAANIKIKRSADDLANLARKNAEKGGYELLVHPVELDLTFTHGGQTDRAGLLNGYAPKYIALPEGIDPNRITTGVIVNPDGTVFHVPTVVTKIDNRYFALINDLRSSGTYSVIWNPQDFEDVRNHWGREDVNNVAARLDLKGNGDNTFSPNRHITRSEFAEIVVLGLGLMRQDAPQAHFADVPASAWYKNAVALANEFDIVRGYDDGNFKGNQQITREQGFAMIARAYRLIQSEELPGQEQIASALAPYADKDQVAAWAQADVAQLISAGIIQGNGPEVLSPKAEMTRAEVTALIARMLKVTNLIDK